MKRTIISITFLFSFLVIITSAQQWTWMKGSKSGSRWGVYGTKGVSDPANTPGARWAPVTWTDNNGKLWLFGGDSYTSNSFGRMNDLWKYDPPTKNWTWVSGESVGNLPGNFGTKGVSDPTNVPGGREGAVGWVDKYGYFWLFGGYRYDVILRHQYYNDLWKYDPYNNLWTWMNGPDSANQSGIYGTQGIANINNTPGARHHATTWTDLEGNLWLFGGYGTGSLGSIGYFNDLWKYNINDNTWTWMKGNNYINGGAYVGVKSVPGPSNVPASSSGAVGWTDDEGNLWLFGGLGYLPAFGISELLWKYDISTNNWTWINGSTFPVRNGVYGTIEVPAPTNSPGGRYYHKGWKDRNGNFWFFGGEGYGSTSIDEGRLNDLWKYDVNSNTWTWIKGSDQLNRKGIYGTKEIEDQGNNPGSRLEPGTWTDKSGNFWLFGGWSFDADSVSDYTNDLWKYTPEEEMFCVDVEMNEGWNIISLPVSPNNRGVLDVFPDASSQAFSYNNGYQTITTLDLGYGYWLKYNKPDTIKICGYYISSTIPVNAGWNIIGPFNANIPVSQISSIPTGIITSQFFGYSNGYVTSSTLERGKGYWIKTSEAGSINLGNGLTIKENSNKCEIDKDWPTIELTDAEGRNKILYLSNERTDLNEFELPPVPPKGIFDCRFTSDRFVEELNSDAKEIKINSAEFPITIKVKDVELKVTDILGGKIVNENLKSGESITINNSAIEVLRIENITVPDQYKLYQNYPNPFNPSTAIKYQLKGYTYITLKVYDILGNEVKILYSGWQNAGSFKINFDASQLPTGTYFYQLKTNDYTSTKKMMLIK